MKTPSKNIARSLRGQIVRGRNPAPLAVGKQRALDLRAMTLPGEGGVMPPPGAQENSADAAGIGAAVGRVFAK